MTGERVTLTLPVPLAHELGEATQEFLADLLARGLREVKIERADILDMARSGDRFRVVIMNGSRANPNAPRDIFQDSDHLRHMQALPRTATEMY